MIELPELYTARFLAESLLTSGDLVPVRCSQDPPIIPLPYALETAWTLLPEPDSFGDSPKLSYIYWRALDRTGLGKVASELSEISARHDHKPLALLDYSDVEKGHGSPRIMFARWWAHHTGQVVPELNDMGEHLHHSELPAQVRVKVPEPRNADHRWRETIVRPWPLSYADFAEWVAGRHWQAARSDTNPHSYSLRRWGDDLMFERVVLFIREHGYQHKFGSRWYTQYDCGGHFYWTMGAPLSSTSLINRKQSVSEERPAEPGLFDREERA